MYRAVAHDNFQTACERMRKVLVRGVENPLGECQDAWVLQRIRIEGR
jgi:hypothetical protein